LSSLIVKIKTRKEVGEISPYVLGKKLEDIKKEYGLTSIRKLSENENVYGCSERVKRFLANLCEDLHLYPDGSVSGVTHSVSDLLQIKPDNLVFGNGSDEVIRILAKAYLNQDEEAIMADKTFPRYRTNVFLEGGKPVTVPLLDGKHDLEGMLSAITKKTKMIFVCNPNNPTGTIVGKNELYSFIKRIPPHILVIVDEAYYEYVTTDDYLQTIPLLEEFSNLVILRTFSKIYGLASLRIGYGVMNVEVAKELRKVKDVFNVNHIAQKAAQIAIHDLDHIQACSKRNKAGKTYLEQELKQLNLTYFPSEANFIMIDCKISGDEISNFLMENGIIVRSGSLLGFTNMIRYTIGTSEDNEHFISLLHQKLMQEAVR
jgi:histidinol-phosphate aminotransferase